MNVNIDTSKLNTYSNGDNEQQTVCPNCGSRTMLLAVDGQTELHECINCSYTFLLDLSEDE